MSMRINDFSTSFLYSTVGETEQKEQVSTTQNRGNTVFSDSVSKSSDGVLAASNDPARPLLAAPRENPSNTIARYTTSNKTLTYESSHYDTFIQTLRNKAEERGLEEGDINQLIFAYMTGAKLPDARLNKILGEISEEVQQEMSEMFGEEAFPDLQDQTRKIKEKGSGALSQAQRELDALRQYAKTLPPAQKSKLEALIQQALKDLDGVDAALQKMPAGREGLDDYLAALDSKISDFLGKLEERAAAFGKDSAHVDASFSLSRTIASIRSEMGVFTDDISSTSLHNQLAQGNWSKISSTLGNTYSTLLGMSYASSFDTALTTYAEANNLSSEQTAKIRFAHHFPEFPAENNVAAALNEVNALALSNMSGQWGMPPGYVPTTSNTRFAATIGFSYDQEFDKQLDTADLATLANTLGVSQERAQSMLRFLHFNKDASTESPEGLAKFLGLSSGAGVPALLQQLENLEANALAKTASAFGLPEGYMPSSGAINYNAMLDGLFLQQFEQTLKNFDPPLSREAIQQVRQAIADPLNPAISAETKQLIGAIYNQSLSALKGLYNLPAGWAPSISTLTLLDQQPKYVQVGMAAVDQLSSQINILATHVDAMPNGPSKSALIDVLKTISQAIASLKEMLAQMQVVDSEVASKWSELQLEMTLHKIELQRTKSEEVRKKQDKAKKLNEVLRIFGAIGKVLMGLFMVAIMGPVGVLMLAATIQDIANESSGSQKKNFLTEMFMKIHENLPAPANLVISAAVLFGMVVAGGAIAGVQMMLEHSHIIQEVIKMFGGSEQAAEITAMVVQLVVEIVSAIVLIVFTAGSSTPAMIGRIAAKVANGLAKVCKGIGNVLQKGSRIASWFTEKAQKLTRFADDVTKAIEKIGEASTKIRQLKKAQEAGETVAKNLLKAAKSDHKKAVLELRKLIDLMRGFMTGVEVFSTGSRAVTSFIQAGLHFTLAEIAEMRARYDAEIAELQALIKLLKQLVSAIFQGMSGMGEHMEELQNAMDAMYTQLSQSTSAIANAA